MTTSFDPIVQEIHRTRTALWQRYGENFNSLVDALMQEQQQHNDRLMILPPSQPVSGMSSADDVLPKKGNIV